MAAQLLHVRPQVGSLYTVRGNGAQRAHQPTHLCPPTRSRVHSAVRCKASTTSERNNRDARRRQGEVAAAQAAVERVEEQEVSTSGSSTQPRQLLASLGVAWEQLPSRYKLVLAASLSFVICNMDKVNMSVAIIPMAQDFGWSSSVSGIVQSAFFWGYAACQLPSGYLSSRYGGRKVLPGGVATWSLATVSVPFLAGTIPGLCISRALVGLGEAAAPSAATDIVARVVPKQERSRAVSFIFGGLHVGSILGLLLAPYIISHWGWETVFVVFGAAGLVWVAWFERLLAQIEEADPEIITDLDNPPKVTVRGRVGEPRPSTADDPGAIPYRAFVRNKPVQALMFTHFCNNWFHYTMLAWLPTYFTDTLSIDLMHAAQTALLPPLAGIAASAAAGPLADGLISKGWKTEHVRKLAQNVAFLGPTICLLAVCTPQVADNNTLLVAAITAALGLSSFSLAGLYCSHQDLSPKYASALLGLTNTTGAVPGIVGVAVVGFLYDLTQSWEWALFLPSAFFMVAGSAVYTLQGRNSRIDFDEDEDNSPFAFEKYLPFLKGINGSRDY